MPAPMPCPMPCPRSWFASGSVVRLAGIAKRAELLAHSSTLNMIRQRETTYVDSFSRAFLRGAYHGAQAAAEGVDARSHTAPHRLHEIRNVSTSESHSCPSTSHAHHHARHSAHWRSSGSHSRPTARRHRWCRTSHVVHVWHVWHVWHGRHAHLLRTCGSHCFWSTHLHADRRQPLHSHATRMRTMSPHRSREAQSGRHFSEGVVHRSSATIQYFIALQLFLKSGIGVRLHADNRTMSKQRDGAIDRPGQGFLGSHRRA